MVATVAMAVAATTADTEVAVATEVGLAGHDNWTDV